jgi:glycosyltransferase involved in cell wall biosynthesis
VTLSVVVLTFNAEATLGATLAAAGELSDELHVVDSGSTDRTLEIARAAGARIAEHPFEHYGAQRNWAIDTLPLAGDWELHLDADERPSPELVAEIRRLLADPPAEVAGFYIPRLVHFLGQPLRHGGMYPIYHLRLFRRGRGRCEMRLYDQHFYVAGPTRRLANPMIDDIRGPFAEWKARHRRWAEMEARQLAGQAEQGERAEVIAGGWDGDPVRRKRALREAYNRLPPFVRPVLLFLYRYVLRGGFRDGRRGLKFYYWQTLWFRWQIDRELVRLRRSK